MIAMRRFRSAASERAAATGHRACAEWFAEELRSIGFSASVRDTPGRPITVGHDRGSHGPSVLFCGEAGPGDLSCRNQRDEAASSSAIRAVQQCSTDQSIQLMAFVDACRSWKAVAGQLPTAVSVLVAGEGWSGSVALTSFIQMYADELKADLGLAPAAGVWRCATPAINSMLRGICCEEFSIVVDGNQLARPDAEAVVDPTQILARILGDLHDASGHVAIPDFYADVKVPLLPQSGRSPTCQIDSLSGSRSDGGQLATSPRAFARLSFHLVCDQVPDVIRRAFRDFARARVPPGPRIEFVSGISAPPISFTTGNPAFHKARQALTAEWDRQAVFACGDAAPAIHALHEVLGMEAVVISFPKRPDDCRHPPETSDLARSYRFGVRSWARILDALAR